MFNSTGESFATFGWLRFNMCFPWLLPVAQAGGTTVHPSLRKHFTTAGAGLVVKDYVPRGQCLLRVRASIETWNKRKWYEYLLLLRSAFFPIQPTCFFIGLPHRIRLAAWLSRGLRYIIWGSTCSCVNWDHGVGASKRMKKLRKFVVK